MMAFEDINKQAPTHILLIPKIKDNLDSLLNAEEKNIDLLGRLLLKTKDIAKD